MERIKSGGKVALSVPTLQRTPSKELSRTFSDDVDDEFGHDELFFGSIPVWFEAVPGDTLIYNHREWEPLTDKASVDLCVSRASKLGPKRDIVVPAIPACDLGRSPPSPTKKRDFVDDDDAELEEGTLDSWPIYLQRPLLKIKEELNSCQSLQQ